MKDIVNNISTWIQSLNGWQKELAYRILSKPQLGTQDIEEVVRMLKDGIQFEEKEIPIPVTTDSKHVVLSSIGPIENIEQLAPRKPLQFAETGLTVVYGSNGSGKSGYTRILKKICGKPHSRDLKGNIYSESENIGKCFLTYIVDGIKTRCEWNVGGSSIEELKAISIFDSDVGWAYVNEENEVSYLPPIISFLTKFANYHDNIKNQLTNDKSLIQANLPIPPADLNDTNFIKVVYNLFHLDLSKFAWLEDEEKKLCELEQELRQEDFSKVAKDYRLKMQKLDSLIREVEIANLKVSEQAQSEVIGLKEDLLSKERALRDAGQALNDTSKFEGIGTESWQQLWLAAKEYARKEAYKDERKLHEHELCVLCHQPLSQEAKVRLEKFETFIVNTFSKEVNIAKTKYDNKIKELPLAPTQEDIDNKCLAAGLDQNWFSRMFNVLTLISNNANEIRNGKTIIDIDKEVRKDLDELKQISKTYESEAIKNETNAKSFNREEKTRELLELRAKKWSTEQLDSILEAKRRNEEKAKYDGWISQTKTRPITDKAKEISDILITTAFIERFNNELQKLGAKNIRVRFHKSGNKGKTTHVLEIDVQKKINPASILSEGEVRIVELAAFLADVIGGNDNTPFVFDDPISSLDQNYEEKVIHRLAELSETRQVIVFTHRLSTLSQLFDECKTCNAVQMYKETWGTGETGKLNISAKKPRNALNSLKNEDLAQARKIKNEKGSEAYYPYAKQICSDFRNLLESVVEQVLLNGVAQRYRKSINTMGKIKNLAKIQLSDCMIIDKLMTKYSFTVHSQPQETPRDILEPDEIEKDIDELTTWIEEFSNRKIDP